MVIHEVVLHKEEDLIDSEGAAKFLEVSKNNLRQMVHRKQLVPLGRQTRRSFFLLADVVALKARRDNRGIGKR